MRVLCPCAAVFLLAGGAIALSAEGGSPDPAFASIPFDRWVEEGDQAHMHWTAHVMPAELSNHQRLLAKVELVVDGKEIARRRGQGYFVMLVEFSDSENRVYQTHQAIDLQQAKEDAGKSDISYVQGAFVTPGDYRISLAVFDTATGEHSGMRLPLHINPLKNDSLPGSWDNLPPVEIPRATDSPDDLYLPKVTGRLHLPLQTQHAVRVELLVNASPLSAGEPSPREQINNRSLASLIPAMKVISNTDIKDGSLNASVLDLTTQKVIFQQTGVRDLDWEKLGPALKQAGPNVIDIHALEKRQQNAQFFLSEVRKRLGVSGRATEAAGPLPVLIVLSGPTSFSSGEDLHPIELGSKTDCKVFYIRYHSLPPQPVTNPFFDESRRGRRMGTMQQPGRNPAAITEPVDALERTLKPLQPRLYDVYSPDQFRKALSNMLDEISRL